jgi:hypothetical protein
MVRHRSDKNKLEFIYLERQVKDVNRLLDDMNIIDI